MDIKPLPSEVPLRTRTVAFLYRAGWVAVVLSMVASSSVMLMFSERQTQIIENQAEAETLLIDASAVACRILKDDPTVVEICSNPAVLKVLTVP